MRDEHPRQLTQQPTLLDAVKGMVQFANKGKIDPRVRSLVEEICKDIAQGDYASEVLACYYWVCQNIRYMRDIQDVEYVSEPRRILETRAGDCDDMSVLLAAMLLTCGNSVDFVLASFVPSGMPSHVFVQVRTPTGVVPLDPVANFDTAKMISRILSAKVIRVG